MHIHLTEAEISNLITACATSGMRRDSMSWQIGLDAIADKLRLARDAQDQAREDRISAMIRNNGYTRQAAEYELSFKA